MGTFGPGLTFSKGVFEQITTIDDKKLRIVFSEDCRYFNGILIEGVRRIYE